MAKLEEHEIQRIIADYNLAAAERDDCEDELANGNEDIDVKRELSHAEGVLSGIRKTLEALGCEFHFGEYGKAWGIGPMTEERDKWEWLFKKS